jgi:integrase/recombinase XerC
LIKPSISPFFMRMYLDEFISHIKHERRYSAHTAEAYSKDLSLFSSYLSDEYECNSLTEATHVMIRSWMVAELENGVKVSSVKRRVSTLRSFFKFAQSRGKLAINPMLKIVSPKSEKLLPNYVKESEMHHLLEKVEFEDGFSGLRDKLILEILYQTGMRVSELTEMSEGSVDFQKRELKVLGKRNKERIIPVSKELSEKLDVYVKEKKANFSENKSLLMVKDDGDKADRKFVYNKVKYYLSHVSSLNKRSPHVLRHTFATHMLKNGADLNAIKEILGHASLAATQVYAHNSLEQLKLSHKNAHPRK